MSRLVIPDVRHEELTLTGFARGRRWAGLNRLTGIGCMAVFAVLAVLVVMVGGTGVRGEPFGAPVVGGLIMLIGVLFARQLAANPGYNTGGEFQLRLSPDQLTYSAESMTVRLAGDDIGQLALVRHRESNRYGTRMVEDGLVLADGADREVLVFVPGQMVAFAGRSELGSVELAAVLGEWWPDQARRQVVERRLFGKRESDWRPRSLDEEVNDRPARRFERDQAFLAAMAGLALTPLLAFISGRPFESLFWPLAGLSAGILFGGLWLRRWLRHRHEQDRAWAARKFEVPPNQTG